MTTEYEPLPGTLHHRGRRFVCPCGCSEFRVEIGSNPLRFWCECGAMYTEWLVDTMGEERLGVMEGG